MFTLSSIFLIFGGLAIFSAIMVVGAPNPVHSILYLVLAFASTAGLFMILKAEFISLVFIVVYVGAIAVLFLFVVILLNVKFPEGELVFSRFIPVGSFIGLIFASEIFITMELKVGESSGNLFFDFNKNSDWFTYLDLSDNFREFGIILFTEYGLPFLLGGVILLLAIVAAILLTIQARLKLRRQHLFQQLSRKFDNAVFLTSSSTFFVEKKKRKGKFIEG